MWYACIGATETGARCRNEAVADRRCRNCAEENRPSAPAPTHVLIKFVVGGNWAKTLERAGVPRVEPDWEEREKAHTAEAFTHGQDQHAYKRTVDSGSAVFGREGLHGVGITGSWLELLEEGFTVQDVHLERNRRGNDVLILALAKAEEKKFSSDEALILAKGLIGFAWGYVHVWANPPKADASVVHTVNCAGPGTQGADNTRVLVFAKGLWGIS